MADIQYALGKFEEAIDGMATGSGSLQERLRRAPLSWIAVFDTHFPAGEMREHYQLLNRRLNSIKPAGDEGSLDATTQKMTDAEAGELAHLVLEFREELQRALRVG